MPAAGNTSSMYGSLRLIVVASLVAAGCGVARGGETAAAPVGEVGPEIYYLQDEAGRLVPAPGFQYRDFLELLRLRDGLPAALEPPAAVLEDLVVRCDLTRANPAAGTCPASVECAVRQTRGGWTRLPLGLDGFVLSGPPRHEGSGRVVVDADPGGGYRGWFDAAANADARHVLMLDGVVPVELSEGRDLLTLRMPAATAATIEIRTPRPEPLVVVVPPPPGRPVVTRDADGTSVVTIAGVSGAVRIRLGAAGVGEAAWEAVPQSVVESTVRIDGRSAFIDADIRLENLPPDTETIDVTLPPLTVFRGVRPPATLVARGGTADAPTVTIAVERGRDGRAAVALECERPVDPSGVATVEAIGFAVAQVESWRQWGRVMLVVEGDWRAEWVDRPGVRRVDAPPAARRPGFVAAFAYDALPASLPVRVRPRVSRVVVEPAYRYDVGAARIALTATVRVAARGAPATGLVMEVDPTFDIDDVGPPGLVDVTAVAVERGRVTIPFLQPLAGDAVIELRGVRRIDRDITSLSWSLPVPKADVVAPASVTVAADSDIEILPDAAASVGLARQTMSGSPRPAGMATLDYRMDGTRATFAGTRRFLARRVDAVADVRVRLDDAEAEVVETIRLDVAHVPLEYLEFAVPESVIASASLEIRQDGVVLDPIVAESEGGGAVPVRVVLAEPLLGPGEATVSFRLPMPAVPPETTVATDLPLVLPTDALLERERLTVESVDRLAVDVRGAEWRAEAAGDGTARSWIATRSHDSVPLAIAARQRAAVDAVAEATWLRTDVLVDRREDAATIVLSGGGEGATLAVPAAPDTVTCTVTLDGTPLPATRDEAGRFTVTLPRAAGGRRRVVEVRTTAALPSGWAAVLSGLGLPHRVRLDPPTFGTGVAQRRFFWDVSTRADEHILGAPDAWTAQQRWRLGGRGFERAPTVDRAALALWIRDAAGGPVAGPVDPPLVERRAVYSGVGPPGTAALWIVPTWCAVLVASGAALAVGLTLAYVAAARRPAVVVPLLAAVGIGAAALPDLAPLAAQASLPGVALALLAWILRGVFDRDTRPPVARPVAPGASASSLTRTASPPSLVVAGSSLIREGSVTAGGRSSA